MYNKNLIEDSWKFVWITDFPMFEHDVETKKWKCLHHPFTMPKFNNKSDILNAPEKLLSHSYDLVLNGTELGDSDLMTLLEFANFKENSSVRASNSASRVVESKNNDDSLKEYKTLSAGQRSLNLELAKLEKMQEKVSQSLDMVNPSSQDDDIEERLADLEEATKSMDLYRTQVNQSILSLKEKLNDFKKNFNISDDYCFNNYETLLKNKEIDRICKIINNHIF